MESMRLSSVALFLILPAVAHAKLTGTTGHVDCKCIDPNILSVAQNAGYTWNVTCADPGNGLLQSVGGSHCYPNGYGARTCQDWDRKLPPHCALADGTPKSDAPSWCEKTWCYVDKNTCRLKVEKSSYFLNIANLAYSYGTCGDPDYFGDWDVAKQLRNVNLRVALMDEPPYVHPNRTKDEGQGILLELYTEIFAKAGNTWRRVDLQPYNGSSYDACVRDVSFGHVDLCLGSFWETVSRRKMTEFVTPFAADPFRLVAKRAEVEDKVDILAVAAPFTPGLWVAVSSIIIIVGVVIFILERRDAGEDHENFKDSSWLFGISQSIYLSCFGFWSAAPAHAPSTRGGKIVTVAFGIFLMLTLAGYTANLASFLVTKKINTGSLKDIEDAVSKGISLCMYGSIGETLAYSVPQASKLLVPVASTKEAFEKLHAGGCGAIVNGNENTRALTEAQHCDKMEVGGVIMSISLAQPVNSEWARALSYWMVESLGYGRMMALEATYASTDHCASNSAENVEAPDKMSIKDFYGTFLLTAVVMVMGLMYRAFRIFLEWKTEGDKAERNKLKRCFSTARLSPGKSVDDHDNSDEEGSPRDAWKSPEQPSTEP